MTLYRERGRKQVESPRPPPLPTRWWERGLVGLLLDLLALPLFVLFWAYTVWRIVWPFLYLLFAHR